MLHWIAMTSENQIEEILQESDNQPVLIFKHSTSCSISGVVKNRLERGWDQTKVGSLKAYYLDLHRYRNLSNLVESRLGVQHESPQVLLIKNGKSIYHESHFGISFEDLSEAV